MNYTYNHKIRSLYKDLAFVQRLSITSDLRGLKELIIERKLELRKAIAEAKNAAKQYASLQEFEYQDGSDSIVSYAKMEFEDAQEAKEWCNSYYEANQIRSPYDCTGSWFCYSIRWAHMKDHTWLIRVRMNRDV